MPPPECRKEGVCFRGNCTYELLAEGSFCNDGINGTISPACDSGGNCLSTGNDEGKEKIIFEQTTYMSYSTWSLV